jgi:hypothetical protein
MNQNFTTLNSESKQDTLPNHYSSHSYKRFPILILLLSHILPGLPSGHFAKALPNCHAFLIASIYGPRLPQTINSH